MRVVSDTSTVSNLAILGCLDLLRSRFARVVLPKAVLAELERLTHSGGRAAINVALNDGWLAVEHVADQSLVTRLARDLDAGESEAVALACESNANLLLIDESEGRASAARLGLKVTGVLGILLGAKLDGQITSLRSEIDRLREEAHFFIAHPLEVQLLKAAGE